MNSNPLAQLAPLGQSVWLDLIRRNMLVPGGDMQRLIEKDSVRGVTSNPAIFEKAINGSADYDDEIRTLGKQGKDAVAIYEHLAISDVGRAADFFRPLHDSTQGADGFVSIEVSPKLAHDAEGTLVEARRLWKTLNRPNIMIKIPGTKAGLVAIRKALTEGININITLLFAVERYEAVLEAYVAALADRANAGGSIDRIASVASFFLSRIDTLLDPMIEKVAQAGGAKGDIAHGLPGTIAVANAKIAYQKYEAVIGSDRWKKLAAKSARPQRLLWASTSTKNPKYSDTMYVEPLIGPDTVNTMPMETVEAYRDHGKPAVRIREGVADAARKLAQLKEIGIDLVSVTQQLEDEGVKKFIDPFEKLIASIEAKRKAVLASVKS
ncbi:MAG TPA: transaldolase [Planctomycetota bacterium]|nr:transaldolase [Planctomycetota bacterium]